VNGRHFPEQDMVRLIRGTCLAVRAMHEYRPTTPGSAMPASQNGTTDLSAATTTKFKKRQQEDDDEDNDERFPQAEGDPEGGYSYDGSAHGSSVPLVTRHRVEDEPENDIVFDGDEELQQQQANSTLAVVPYAHRDLKPG